MGESVEKSGAVPENFRIATQPRIEVPDQGAMLERVVQTMADSQRESEAERNELLFHENIRTVIEPYTTAIAAFGQNIQSSNEFDSQNYEPITQIDRKRGGLLWRRVNERTRMLGAKWVNTDSRSGNQVTEFSRLQILRDPQNTGHEYQLLFRPVGTASEAESPILGVNSYQSGGYTSITLDWKPETSEYIKKAYADKPDVLRLVDTTESLSTSGKSFRVNVILAYNEKNELTTTVKLQHEDEKTVREVELEGEYSRQLSADTDGGDGPSFSLMRAKEEGLQKINAELIPLKQKRRHEITYSFDRGANALQPEVKNSNLQVEEMNTESFANTVKSLLSVMPTHSEPLDGGGAILTMALPGEKIAA